MMSSETLKMFVKAHEQKLNAKISGSVAGRHELSLPGMHAGGNSHASSSMANHWNLRESDIETRHRPKSRYFNFILTTTHQ